MPQPHIVSMTNQMDTLFREVLTKKYIEPRRWAEITNEGADLARKITVALRDFDENIKASAMKLNSLLSLVLRYEKEGYAEGVRTAANDGLQVSAQIREWASK